MRIKKVTEALMNGAAAFFSRHDDPMHILHTVHEVLHCGYSTVENYRNSPLRKTGTHNTTQLLNFAKQAGWLDEENDK